MPRSHIRWPGPRGSGRSCGREHRRVRELVCSRLRGVMNILKAWRTTACLSVALIAAGSGESGVAQATPGTMTSGTLRPAVASTSLCRSIGQVDRLVVRRVDELPQNHIHFSFPAVTVVTEAASVQDVAKVVCALPRIPMGVMSCVVDLGIYYRLSFTAADRELPTVVVDATGCQTVLGSARSAGLQVLRTSGAGWARPWGWQRRPTRRSEAPAAPWGEPAAGLHEPGRVVCRGHELRAGIRPVAVADRGPGPRRRRSRRVRDPHTLTAGRV